MLLTPDSELNIQTLSCCSLHQKEEWSGIRQEEDELLNCVLRRKYRVNYKHVQACPACFPRWTENA